MKNLLIVVLVAGAFAGGYGYGRWYGKPAGGAKAERKVLYWVDPMHPWYKANKPGIAPDCNMALEPVYEGEAGKYEQTPEGLAAGAVQVTPEKQQLIGVELGSPEYTTTSDSIRAVAKVALDETRVAKVQTKIDGWVDEVFVDFTGKEVKKGQPLLTIYSPEALATQSELLLAARAHTQARDNPVHEMMASTTNLLEAARKRLSLWDISDEQVERVLRTGSPSRTSRSTRPSPATSWSATCSPSRRSCRTRCSTPSPISRASG